MTAKSIIVKTYRTQDHNQSEASAPQEVFRRTEVKYLLTPAQKAALLDKLGSHLVPDRYFKGTNCSVYFDTDDHYLAIHSMEKPMYKEKIRVRSYNAPKSLNDTVFLEIKKKFHGVGNKRRVAVTLRDFYHYIDTGHLETENPQIKAELDYCFSLYDLKPMLYLAYDRLSYCGADDPDFRVTFDHNVRYRTRNLRLENGSQGEPYFKNGEIIMEVKAHDSFPLWFVKALSDLKIYPASFSKYGKVSYIILKKENQYV